MRKLLLFLLIVAPAAKATTWTAADCNQATVQTLINAGTTLDGDTVIIPNGTCNWGGTLTFSKQITLQGQTAGSVILNHTNTTACGGTSPCANGSILINITIGSSFHTTLANIVFNAPATACGATCGPYLYIHGSGLTPLVHDMVWNMESTRQFQAIQWFANGGVVWNNTIQTPDVLGTGGCWVYKPPVPPAPAWDSASTMGALDDGTKNLYVEDSTFTEVDQCIDADDNARVVIRHSTLAGTSGLTHGVTSTFAGRQVEYYNDTFSFPGAPSTSRDLARYFWSRAGTQIYANNSLQSIFSGAHGQRSTFQFTVEDVQRSGGPGECTTGWMGWHQSGAGASNSTQSPSYIGTQTGGTRPDANQIPAPIYIFNNTGTGNGTSFYSLNDGAPNVCNNTNPATGAVFKAADIFKFNRDLYTDDTSVGPNFTPVNATNDEQIGVGLLSGRPSAGFVNDAYYATDTTTLYSVQPVLGQAWNYTPIATEAILRQGGGEGVTWKNGAATGLDWKDVQTSTTQNLMFPTSQSTGCPGTPANCTDSTAIMAGSWTADQEAMATVVTISPGNSCCHEVELRLRTTITAHSITGYEINCSVSGGNYLRLIRWDGSIGNFTQIGSAATGCVNGDVLKATIIGSTIKAYKNNVQQFSVTDATYATGSPGVGFLDTFDTSFSNMGLTNFKAASLSGATWATYWTPFTYPHPLRGNSAVVSFSPSSLAFNNVPVGVPSNPQTVTFQNTGTVNLSNTSIQMNNGKYFIQNNTCGSPSTITINIPGTGFTLTPGSTCTFQVVYQPIGAGNLDNGGAVFFENTATGQDQIGFTGTGTAPPAPGNSMFAGTLPRGRVGKQ